MSHRAAPAGRRAATGAAGVGLGVLVLAAGPLAGLIGQAVADTIIVVGGADDPESADNWKRIGGRYVVDSDTGGANKEPVLIEYPATVLGMGIPGLALAKDGRTTYVQSVDNGADATVAAIEAARAANPDENIVIYGMSEGTDVANLAIIRYGQKHPQTITAENASAATDTASAPTRTITVVNMGSPSFIRSGAWSVVPAGMPGLRYGPTVNSGTSGAKVTSICIRGDLACGIGDPLTTAFYAIPGIALHSTAYNADYIGQYSPVDGTAYTPGATGTPPLDTKTVVVNGRTITEDTYADGTVKRTWDEDGTTWVVIDTGENPWMRLARESGIPVSRDADKVLNALIPTAQPGEVSSITSYTRPPALVALVGDTRGDKGDAGQTPVARLTAVTSGAGGATGKAGTSVEATNDDAKHRSEGGGIGVRELLERFSPSNDDVHKGGTENHVAGSGGAVDSAQTGGADKGDQQPAISQNDEDDKDTSVASAPERSTA